MHLCYLNSTNTAYEVDIKVVAAVDDSGWL